MGTRPWTAFAALYLVSVALAVGQFKLPPVLPILSQSLQLSMAQGGFLMSVFALTGTIVALPTALAGHRHGWSNIVYIALLSMLAGTALGLYAPSYLWLLASRALEGIGMGLIAVAAPVILATLFPPAQLGFPMGIWATWVPVASLLSFNLIPRLAQTQWQNSWKAGLFLTVLALVAFLPAFRRRQLTPIPSSVNSNTSLAAVWRLPVTRWLTLQFAIFNLLFLAVVTWFPTYLAGSSNLTPQAASFNTSFAFAGSAIGCILAGWLWNCRPSPRMWGSLPFLLLGFFFILSFRIPAPLTYWSMLAAGLVGGFIPTATFSLVPLVVSHPKQAGVMMGLLVTAQNIGMLIGPLFLAQLVERTQSWPYGTLMMFPLVIAGSAAWLLVSRVNK